MESGFLKRKRTPSDTEPSSPLDLTTKPRDMTSEDGSETNETSQPGTSASPIDLTSEEGNEAGTSVSAQSEAEETSYPVSDILPLESDDDSSMSRSQAATDSSLALNTRSAKPISPVVEVLPSPSQTVSKSYSDVNGYRVSTDHGDILGNGSFGIVYKGLGKDGQQIAAKRIDFKKAKHLPAEIDQLTDLQHENIVKIYDVCRKEGGVIWIMMEFCPLGDLTSHWPEILKNADRGRLTRGVMLDIAKGLEFLHDKNIIHRDLCPRNILVAEPCRAKLTDFDVCKFLGEDYTSSMMTSNIGHQTFQAPEFFKQTWNLQYRRSVDIWALGLIFLVMLQRSDSLEPVIETTGSQQKMKKRANKPIGKIVSKRAKPHTKDVIYEPQEGDPDNWIRRLIRQMTTFKPGARPSAAEVAAEMVTIIASLPVSSVHSRSRGSCIG